MSTTETEARPRGELHEACPKCGLRFPSPQRQCRNEKACKRRQEAGGAAAVATPAAPRQAPDAADEAKQGVKERISQRADARRRAASAKGEGVPAGAAADELGQELNDSRPIFNVQLRTDAQVAVIDRLFPGRPNGDTLRSGRAGKRFLVFEADVEAIIGRFDAELEQARSAEASPERDRHIGTVEALVRNFDAARSTAVAA